MRQNLARLPRTCFRNDLGDSLVPGALIAAIYDFIFDLDQTCGKSIGKKLKLREKDPSREWGEKNF